MSALSASAVLPRVMLDHADLVEDMTSEGSATRPVVPAMLGDRYLFGDSSPFSGNRNILTQFEAFLELAGRCLRLLGNIEQSAYLAAQRIERREESRKYLVELSDAVQKELLRQVESVSRSTISAAASTFCDRVSEAMQLACQNYVDETARVAAVERRQSDEMSKRHWTEVRQLVDRFLLRDDLDLEPIGYSVEPYEGGYHVRTVCQGPADLTVCFGLAVPPGSLLDSPLRFQHLLGRRRLCVGTRTNWLGQTRPVWLNIGPFVLGRTLLISTGGEFVLARSHDAPGDVTLTVTDGQDRSAEIRGTVPQLEAGAVCPVADEEFFGLCEVMGQLRRAAEQCTKKKLRVEWAKVGDQDLYAGEQLQTFIWNLAKHFEPDINEIASRSPAPNEISLKLERPDGSREEKYLRKPDLAVHFRGLAERWIAPFRQLSIFPSAV